MERISCLRDTWMGVRLRRQAPTFGGIITADRYTYPSQVVVVLDPGSTWMKKGDVVLVRSHVGQDLAEAGYNTLTIFREKQSLGKFDPPGVFTSQATSILAEYDRVVK